MLQLSQGYKPARLESRPIQDAHWALIERCWSSIDDRPLAKDIVSSLEDFLRSCPIPQPLCDFLSGIQPAMSDVTMKTGSLTDKYGMSVDSDCEVGHRGSVSWHSWLTISRHRFGTSHHRLFLWWPWVSRRILGETVAGGAERLMGRFNRCL